MRDNGTLRNTFCLLVIRPIFEVSASRCTRSLREQEEGKGREGKGRERKGRRGEGRRKKERKMETRVEIIRFAGKVTGWVPIERYFPSFPNNPQALDRGQK